MGAEANNELWRNRCCTEAANSRVLHALQHEYRKSRVRGNPGVRIIQIQRSRNTPIRLNRFPRSSLRAQWISRCTCLGGALHVIIAHCTLHTAHCTLHIEHCTLHTAHCTPHTWHIPMPIVLYSPHTLPCFPGHFRQRSHRACAQNIVHLQK